MQKQTPYGPKGNFLTGSVREFAADPPQFLLRTAYEYGPISFFRLAHYPIYLLAHPDYVREVLITQAGSFEKGELDRRILGKFLGNGLLTSEGSFHKRQRRLAQPAFHHKRIQSYAEVMVHYTEDMLAGWQSGQIRQVDDEMMRIRIQAEDHRIGESVGNRRVLSAGRKHTVVDARNMILLKPTDGLACT